MIKKRVYVILNLETLRTKIGFSGNTKVRMQSLMAASGCKMKLIYHTKPVANFAELEHDMHVLFSDKRYLGEWFTIDHKIAAIRLKSMVYHPDQITDHYKNGKSIYDLSEALNVSKDGLMAYLYSKGVRMQKYKRIPVKQGKEQTTIKGKSLLEMVKANNERIAKKREEAKKQKLIIVNA
jgi:hypothetical protein